MRGELIPHAEFIEAWKGGTAFGWYILRLSQDEGEVRARHRHCAKKAKAVAQKRKGTEGSNPLGPSHDSEDTQAANTAAHDGKEPKPAFPMKPSPTE